MPRKNKRSNSDAHLRPKEEDSSPVPPQEEGEKRPEEKSLMSNRSGESSVGTEPTREEFDALAAKVEGLEGLTRDVLTGLQTKVAPRIDSLESVIAKLPEQMTASFSKQGELFKKYVDDKLTGEGTPAQGQGGLIGFIMGQVKEAGGIGKLLGGFGGGGQSSLVMEIQDLEKLLLERERGVVRNSLRQALGLPVLPLPAMTSATPGTPTLTHG
jgi:hypothetical protein